MSTSLGTMVTMGLVAKIITPTLNPHMCQINMLLVVIFLVIWKTPLDLLYLLKELNKELNSKFEKPDAMFERLDQLTKEVSSLKSIITTQKHEATIKYCQEVINKSWQHIHEQERFAKEYFGVMIEREVEEVKMLSEVKDPLLDL